LPPAAGILSSLDMRLGMKAWWSHEEVEEDKAIE
jgi:hypothetical protein